MSMAGFPVKVFIYDLTKGLARQLSQAFIGKQIDGVWHTAVVVYDQEFFFGGMGIESCAPGNTVLGQPDQIEDLGNTEIPSDVFFEYLQDLANSSYRPERYHLLDHNCNTFSDDVANFLTGRGIPSHITNLPQEVMATPFGAMIRPFIDSMQVTPSGGSSQRTFTPTVPAAPTGYAGASAAPAPAPVPASATAPAPAPDRSPAIPPATSPAQSSSSSSERPQDAVTFNDAEILKEFERLKDELKSTLPSAEFATLAEVHEFFTLDDCPWSLGKQHIKLVTDLVSRDSLSQEQRVAVAGLLQKALLTEDVLAMLKFTKDTAVLHLVSRLSSAAAPVKRAVLKALCNGCARGRGWLLGTDEVGINCQATSYRRESWAACCSSLLDDDEQLNSLGAALSFNVTREKVGEESAVELGIALLHFATSKDLSGQTARHTLEALEACMAEGGELASLAQVMGLDLDKYPAGHARDRVRRRLQAL